MKVVIVTITILLVGGVVVRQNLRSIQQPTLGEVQRTRNEQLAQEYFREEIIRAKAEGRTEIILPAANVPESAVFSMEDIRNRASLLRVRVMAKETNVSGPYADIRTWYKLAILEVVQDQENINTEQPLPENVPTSFLPLLPSECLLLKSGGTVTIDGIRIVRLTNEDQFSLSPTTEYLIGAYKDYGGKVIYPVASASSIFATSEETLRPLGRKDHRLVREVEEAYSNNLDRIRSSISRRPERRN